MSKMYCLKRVLKLCFLVTFIIIISYIFPENFIHFSCKLHWNLSSLSEDMNIYFFYLTTSSFFYFFTITCYKKTKDASIFKIASTVSWLEIILERLLKNFIKSYFCSSSNMEVGREAVILWPTQNKLPSKSPAFFEPYS